MEKNKRDYLMTEKNNIDIEKQYYIRTFKKLDREYSDVNHLRVERLLKTMQLYVTATYLEAVEDETKLFEAIYGQIEKELGDLQDQEQALNNELEYEFQNHEEE